MDDATVGQVRHRLTACRNRAVSVRGYFTVGSPKWTAANQLVGCLDKSLVLLEPTVEPPPPPPAPDPIERRRPYADDSPWNTPIRVGAWEAGVPAGMPASAQLTSDPTQYTYPVYFVGASTPLVPVTTTGWYSRVYDEGRKLDNQRRGVAQVPIPPEIVAARGSDAQVIIVNRDNGDEYGFWQFAQSASGAWSASNGYRYNVAWSAVPPPPDGGGFTFVSRGAGVPYLTGLVRPWEIEAGVIRHALAFVLPGAGPTFVPPATKSDGQTAGGMPEGARLMLDPAFDASGLGPVAKIVATALKTYGMYVIDIGGSHKVCFEYDGTAHWGGRVTRSTVSGIPLSAFRRVS